MTMQKAELVRFLQAHFDSGYLASRRLEEVVKSGKNPSQDWLYTNSQQRWKNFCLHVWVRVEMALESASIDKVTVEVVKSFLAKGPALTTYESDWFRAASIENEADRMYDVAYGVGSKVKVKKIFSAETLLDGIDKVQFSTNYEQDSRYLLNDGGSFSIYQIHDGTGRLHDSSNFSTCIPIEL